MIQYCENRLLNINQKYLTDDSKKDKVPSNFPMNVLQLRKEGETDIGLSKYVLHEHYRTNGSEEFFYFARRVLPCVNTKFTNYKTKCRNMKLSDVFTVNDEAYALALLINEYDSYKYVIRKETDKLEKDEKRPRKPFTNGVSGNKQGWNEHGLATLTELMKQVGKLRKQEASVNLEVELMEKCNSEAGGRSIRKRKRVIVKEEFDFEYHFEGNQTLFDFCHRK